jgi:plasmid replication initiation protein
MKKSIKKSISSFFGRLSKIFGEDEFKGVTLSQTEPQQAIERDFTPKPGIEDNTIIVEQEKQDEKQIKARRKNPKNGEVVKIDPRDVRDMMEIMEYPYLSLSKNRTAPIYYEHETTRGTVKIKVSCHPPHYVASIYDWDIILFVESKIQEIINYNSDIPPRTLIIPRHEILKALRKHGGNKQNKDLHASLTRLKTTVVETSVRNEDRKYDCFGWLDSWGYTERKDIKEIRITLSQWLYDGICKKGALLKVSQEYFDLTSGLKKFLYRTARKHAGNNNQWEFSVERLYEKSGSEQEFKKFKYDLKKAVLENDIPDYFLEWKEDQGIAVVRFINKKSTQTDKINSKLIGKHVNSVISAFRMPRQVIK